MIELLLAFKKEVDANRGQNLVIERAKLDPPGVALAKKLFDQLLAQGCGRSGRRALFK
jgi:hypothetical protein